jgi:D-alanyl-D-alanine carboxypeptidase
MIGTTSNLEHGDIINIYHLFYALMLPSGNDAAIVLA